jgi:hypothetical protein
MEDVMNRKHLSIVLATVLLLTAAALHAQTPPAAPADAAQTANPELVGALAKEIGATPQQAEGAAGALFGLAKTRLKPEEWTKVAGAVPGMDALLKAAPAATSASTGLGSMAGALPGAAGLGGLAGAADAFKKLGLKPEMAAKAVPVLTNYVNKTGGADVGKLLAGALQ